MLHGADLKPAKMNEQAKTEIKSALMRLKLNTVKEKIGKFKI